MPADEHALDLSDLGTAQLVTAEVRAQMRQEREAWAHAHEQMAADLDAQARRFEACVQADRDALRAAQDEAHARYWDVSEAGQAATLAAEEAVRVRWRQLATDAQTLEAGRAGAEQHRRAAADLRRLNADERVREGGT
jgi:hypothetical protein